jgi:dimethylargininase
LTLDVNRHLPDCAFVEDAAVVLDEAALLCRMGAAARRVESAGIEVVLRRYRDIVPMEPPATLDGGDVLRVGRTLLVGRSSRTNDEGVAALQRLADSHGYRVIPVTVTGCLHLKTACTALDDETLLVNRAWIDVAPLAPFRLIDVPPQELFATNVLPIGGEIVLSQAHERTADLIRSLGHTPRPIDISEFAKAEAGVTCLSVLLWL